MQVDSGPLPDDLAEDIDNEEIENPQNEYRNSVKETYLQSHLSNHPTFIDLSGVQHEDQMGTSVSSGNEIYSIAPGEGKHPIHFMKEKYCEELAFPTLFPTGQFGYQVERDVPILPVKYFNARLLNYTGRFDRNPEYLFLLST